MKKRLKLDLSLYTILQIFSVTVFEQVSILQILKNFDYTCLGDNSDNQLLLFDL